MLSDYHPLKYFSIIIHPPSNQFISTFLLHTLFLPIISKYCLGNFANEYNGNNVKNLPFIPYKSDFCMK